MTSYGPQGTRLLAGIAVCERLADTYDRWADELAGRHPQVADAHRAARDAARRLAFEARGDLARLADNA